jgi:hypothetical protein
MAKNERKRHGEQKAEKADNSKRARFDIAEIFLLNESALTAIEDDFHKLESFKLQLDEAIKQAKNDENWDEHLRLGGLLGILKERLAKPTAAEAKRPAVIAPRGVPLDFKIGRDLMHTFDSKLFKDRVMQLFDWYADAAVREVYMAPCFPLVQSSGMGKTKLLWELRKWVRENQWNVDGIEGSFCCCETVLCNPGKPKVEIGEDSAFSYHLDVPPPGSAMSLEATQAVVEQLDNILEDCHEKEEASGKQSGGRRKVILLFDESQHLLIDKGSVFRSVRRWLRRDRSIVDVVAVFSGTTLQLTNFLADPPEESTTSTSRLPSDTHYVSGKSLYGPFWNLCTIGVLAKLSQNDTAAVTDYKQAVPYGRPLFAVMKDEELENFEPFALSRMLLSETNRWSTSNAACLSILGTRLQMGQTTFDVASKLVANGYAVLSHYISPVLGVDSSACIFFPTDPVCARLAMAMMDGTFEMRYADKLVRGEDKRFWTRKLSEIFATGLCSPSQGDFGELATAAYLLFCGDVLRKKINETYNTFSVPLSTYIECLLQPKNFCGKDGPLDAKVSHTKKGHQYANAHVGFVQVTRNYARFSVNDFFDEGFLKDLYLSGSAFYAYPLFPIFDLVASIRLSNSKNEVTYVPLLVSISTKMDIGTQNEALDRIHGVLKRNKRGGMGLRLLFDQSNSKNNEFVPTLSTDDVDSLLKGEFVSKALIVPHDDPFGVTEMLIDATLCGSGKSEVYASHNFLYHHSRENCKSAKLVRDKDEQEAEPYMDEMRIELLKSRTKSPNDGLDE